MPGGCREQMDQRVKSSPLLQKSGTHLVSDIMWISFIARIGKTLISAPKVLCSIAATYLSALSSNDTRSLNWGNVWWTTRIRLSCTKMSSSLRRKCRTSYRTYCHPRSYQMPPCRYFVATQFAQSSFWKWINFSSPVGIRKCVEAEDMTWAICIFAKQLLCIQRKDFEEAGHSDCIIKNALSHLVQRAVLLNFQRESALYRRRFIIVPKPQEIIGL